MARQELDILGDPFLVLFAGNLSSLKGVDYLLRAFAGLYEKHSMAQLYILGSGPEAKALRRLVRELRIEDVVNFTGRRPFAEMPSWYQACDVFVLPSAAEGLSMAILEAMGAGRPVITTEPPSGLHDAVVDGETGFLVPYGQVKALERALEKLAKAPTLARQLGRTGRRRAELLFDWNTIAQTTADLYDSLIDPASQPPTR